jgi:ferrous iron transport protein A
MTVDDLEKGTSATVVTIHASKELKARFNSFGLSKGAIVFVKARSLAKKTLEISINKTHLALRSSEAELIEVSL